MIKKGLLLLIICAFEANAVAKAKVSAELGFNSAWMHFAEFNTQNDRLLTESGWLPGLQGAINWSYLGLELIGSLQMHQGAVTYDGQTQTKVPYKTNTKTLLVNSEVQLLLSMDIERHWWLQTSVSRNVWNREIEQVNSLPAAGGEPVSGLNEYYRWWQLAAGLHYRFSPKAFIQAAGLWMPDAYLDVEIPNKGRGRIDQPHGKGFNLSILWPLPGQNPWLFNAGYRYEYFPRSQSIIIGTDAISEPQNERHLFNLGISKQF